MRPHGLGRRPGVLRSICPSLCGNPGQAEDIDAVFHLQSAQPFCVGGTAKRRRQCKSPSRSTPEHMKLSNPAGSVISGKRAPSGADTVNVCGKFLRAKAKDPAGALITCTSTQLVRQLRSRRVFALQQFFR